MEAPGEAEEVAQEQEEEEDQGRKKGGKRNVVQREQVCAKGLWEWDRSDVTDIRKYNGQIRREWGNVGRWESPLYQLCVGNHGV